MKRVLIATPAKSGIPSYQMRTVTDVLLNPISGFTCDFMIEDAHQAINLSRNAMAEAAVSGNYDILLMVDSDHPYSRSTLVRILSHADPIVSGLYCKKAPGDPEWLGLRNQGSPETRKDGLMEVAYVPTGFLRIDVSALQTMRLFYPERRYVSTDNGKDFESYELFPIGLVGPNTAEAKLQRLRTLLGEHPGDILTDAVLEMLDEQHPDPACLLGEDYYFSHLARKAGLKLFIDTECHIPHMGTAPYPIPENFVPKSGAGMQVLRYDLSKF